MRDRIIGVLTGAFVAFAVLYFAWHVYLMAVGEVPPQLP